MAHRLPLVLMSAVALLAATAACASAGPLIAPTDTCSGQTSHQASTAAQERAMLCMANYARTESGMAPLERATPLEGSAGEKARDILRCDSFSHYACGREFAYWIRASGYVSTSCWRAGENLAFGSGPLGSVRAIFRAWMRSPEHRGNILGRFTETGIELVSGTLEGFSGTRVWAQHFGTRC